MLDRIQAGTGTIQRLKGAAAALALIALTGCSSTEDVLSLPETPPLSSNYAALVMDQRTGQVLSEFASQERRYPASLTKMMTLYMLFEAIEQGRVPRYGTIRMSPYCSAREPSKLYVKPGADVPVETVIRSLVVKSANDVACMVGEHLFGSEEMLALAMTQKARQLNMNDTTFVNASGLPDDRQVTTARDMARLTLALRNHFPQYRPYYKLSEFEYDGRTIKGHNRLLNEEGVDGMKTGYIRASGFNVVTTGQKNGRDYLIVVMGGKSAANRDDRVREFISQIR